jgi:hypothetical protein
MLESGIIKYGDDFLYGKWRMDLSKVDMPGMRESSYFRFRSNE